MACLLKRYHPTHQPFDIGVQGVRVRVVTEMSDPLFQQWLLYEAHRLGLNVVFREGDHETVLLGVPFPERPVEELHKESRPAAANAFILNVETPPSYPPEAAADLQRRSQGNIRKLLRASGYNIPERMRSSGLPAEARKLRMGRSRLERRETSEIAEDIYGEGYAKVPEKAKQIRDRRYKLKKRFQRNR